MHICVALCLVFSWPLPCCPMSPSARLTDVVRSSVLSSPLPQLLGCLLSLSYSFMSCQFMNAVAASILTVFLLPMTFVKIWK